ncbi:c-type cytochrome [Wenyingzhuangia sp. IMCC45467]
MKNTITTIFILLTFTSFVNAQQSDVLEASMERGKEIYTDFCITCHMPNGKGVKKVYPPLAESDFLAKNRKQSIKAIKYGLSGLITVNNIKYNGNMAPLGLTDDEVADVMNYISNSWGNKNEKIVTTKEVTQLKKEE